jgi:SAM-dependent methyltransferase
VKRGRHAPSTDAQQRQTAISTVKLRFTQHYIRHSGCTAARCVKFDDLKNNVIRYIKMNKNILNQEWINLSQAWIKEAREGKNPTRNGLLDKPMLEECGNINNLKILVCGCGEGRFCRILSQAGAKYLLGIDLCEPMINAANEIKNDKIEYKIADAQNLNFIEDNTFEIVISYLNQCDLSDFKKNTKVVYRVLKIVGILSLRIFIQCDPLVIVGKKMKIIISNTSCLIIILMKEKDIGK